MKLIPTGQGVLVRPILPQAKTSIIATPDAYARDRVHAVVISTGPGRVTRKGVRVAPEVGKGEIVFIGVNPLNSQEVKIGNELFLLVPETSILGKLTAA